MRKKFCRSFVAISLVACILHKMVYVCSFINCVFVINDFVRFDFTYFSFSFLYFLCCFAFKYLLSAAESFEAYNFQKF